MSLIAQFLTVPRELQPIVRACMSELKATGYTLKPEHAEGDYPESATILAKRKGEQYFYVFDVSVKVKRARLWSGYGRSCAMPTFIVHCIPQGSKISGDTIAQLKSLGVGLTMID